jgi:hypothetical protein
MSHDLFSEFDNGKSAAARAVGLLFGGALVAISAITTAAFFFQYAGGMFEFLAPSLSPYLAAATGVLCFEVAALAWGWLAANDADTAAQIAAAKAGSWGAMIGGLATTAVYFTLNTSLISGQLDAATNTAVSLAGGLLIVIGVGAHFALGHVYRSASAGHTAAQQEAQLRAMRAAAAATIGAESTRATLANTVGNIRKSLPDAAARQGQANAGQIMAATFDTYQGQDGRAPAGADKWAARVNGRAALNGTGDHANRPT